MKEMFGMIFVKLDSLDQKVTSLDQKVTSLDQKVTSLDQRVTALDQKVTALDQKVTSLDQKVTKNSIEIESIKLDIKIIAEVQKAQMEQNERDHAKIIELIDNKIGLHSIILKNLTSDIREIKNNQEALEREVLYIKRKIG